MVVDTDKNSTLDVNTVKTEKLTPQEMLSTIGYVHSIYNGGMVDGPGIRSVVFLSGCGLRCKYCHNPDTWALSSGKLWTVSNVLNEILKYEKYYRFSGGGVTVSGGEPLGQAGFVVELFRACRENGIHTALDTSGFAKAEDIRRVLEFTDLLLLDIKSIDTDTYKHVTGVPIDRTLACMDIAREMNVPVWVRFVLVPGLTDNLEEIQRLGEYVRRFENVQKIDVLPFHKSGEHKWEEVGVAYALHDTQPPSLELIETVKDILKIVV